METILNSDGELDILLLNRARLSTGAFITSEGGLAVRLINKTGAASIKGSIVRVSPTTDNAVALIVQGVPDPFGVIYNAGIADGEYVWVIISGIAEVLFVGNTTRGQFARIFLSIGEDSDYVAGYAKAEPYPSSPFSTDKHFCEIGHILNSRTGAGLAKVALHFN